MTTPALADLDVRRSVLEQITSKWTLLVLDTLCTGPKRFNAIRRTHQGITQKALTQCLRRLEANGFVTRSVVSIAPVAVTYSISPLGRSLEPHLLAILAWADEHKHEVRSAQAAFYGTAEDVHSP